MAMDINSVTENFMTKSKRKAKSMSEGVAESLAPVSVTERIRRAKRDTKTASAVVSDVDNASAALAEPIATVVQPATTTSPEITTEGEKLADDAPAEASKPFVIRRGAKQAQEQNGVKRPSPETLTGYLWTIADDISRETGRVATREAVVQRYMAEVEDANESTAQTQFSRWVNFHGLADKIKQERIAARQAEKQAIQEAAKKAKEEARALKRGERTEKQRALEEAKEAKRAEREAKRLEKDSTKAEREAAKEAEKVKRREERQAYKQELKEAEKEAIRKIREEAKAKREAAKNAAPAPVTPVETVEEVEEESAVHHPYAA